MALCTSLSLSILGPPFLVVFAAAGSCSFAIPPYLACVCQRVWASIPFIPSSFLFAWAAPGYSLIPLLLRGGGGLLFFIWSLAVSTFWRWRLPLLLLAYRALFPMRKMFYLLKYNQSRIAQARDKQVEENQDQSMKGCSHKELDKENYQQKTTAISIHCNSG